jgi:hypothetical protein
VSSPASPDPNAPQTLEGKIVLAGQEAAAAISLFAPQVGMAAKLGLAMEPIFSGFARMIIGIFHHHTGVAPANPASPSS